MRVYLYFLERAHAAPAKAGVRLDEVARVLDTRLSLFFGACARSSRESGSAPWRECARFGHAFIFISWSVRTQLPRKRECALMKLRAFWTRVCLYFLERAHAAPAKRECALMKLRTLFDARFSLFLGACARSSRKAGVRLDGSARVLDTRLSLFLGACARSSRKAGVRLGGSARVLNTRLSLFLGASLGGFFRVVFLFWGKVTRFFLNRGATRDCLQESRSRGPNASTRSP